MENNDSKQSGKVASKVASGIVWTYGERLTAQLVSLVVTIILARLLDPKHYGVISMATVFITIANVFVSAGFGNSLVQKKDADELDFSTTLIFSFGVSLVVYSVMFIAAPIIASFYRMDQLTAVIRVMSLRIIVASINSVQHAYISRKMQFKKFFLSTLGGTLISAAVGITLAYCGAGVWALVAQYLTNTTIDTIVLAFTCGWKPKFEFSLKRMKTLFSFGWKLLAASLLDTLYTKIRQLIIGKMYNADSLAYYNQGDKYPQFIVVNINSSIGTVLFPAFSKVQNDKQRLVSMMRQSIRLSSFLMTPILFGMACVAEPLISVLLTDKWLPAVPFLRIFCIFYWFMPIHTVNLKAISATGRSDIYLKLEVIKKIIGVATICVTVFCFDSVLAIAAGTIFTSVLSSFINAYPNTKLLGYSYRQQISDIAPNILVGLIMAISIIFIPNFIANKKLLLAVQIAVGAAVYILASKLLGIRAFKEALTRFKQVLSGIMSRRKKAKAED